MWLNPLLRYAGFEARPAGIRAMLPHVDDFLPVHNLASLTALAAALSRPAPRGRAGSAAGCMKRRSTMEMTNSRVVPAPVAAVWQALNDPAALKACIPGCESLERTGDDEWQATSRRRSDRCPRSSPARCA